ncbi:MAG TPA: hypothetical protein VFU78_18090 [Thermomicrobiales bacterium]|jgi:hypothetical protein|nr:hypothetical protein [Thermomicrobiales bacterium]
MPKTITLPDELAASLSRLAADQHRTMEEVVFFFLREALLAEAPELDAVVASIRAAAPNPATLRPARGALAVALTDAPAEDRLDPAVWQVAWAAAEAEMAALTEADDRTEGRS